MTDGTTIVAFQPSYQAEANRLILAGLAEYFGTIDTSKNPDLDDIARSYGSENVFVAFAGDEMVGTGALVRETETACRVVRMSVKESHRRAGIGTAILNHLIDTASSRGYTTVVLETTVDWDWARSFYLANGFRIVDIDDQRGEINFERRL